MATPVSQHAEGTSEEGLDELVRRKPVRERAMSSITKLLVQGTLQQPTDIWPT